MAAVMNDHGSFVLSTRHTSYAFRIDENGHPEHVHYGKRIALSDIDALALKRTCEYGDSIAYENGVNTSWLYTEPLEYSGEGRGDYRPCPLLIEDGSGITSDFIYDSFEIFKGEAGMQGLPSAYNAEETLVLHFKDDFRRLGLDLYYGVYPEEDMLTRRAVLVNHGEKDLIIHRMESFSMDMMEENLVMMTFGGSWAAEMRRNDRKVEKGTLLSSSSTGFSSSLTNPGFILRKENTDEQNGEAWGFNLIWSGSHETYVAKEEHGLVRVMSGIRSENLSYVLKSGESFETPEAFMTYSDQGLNTLSHHFHDFINEHIVRGNWKKKDRPVLVNSWEACYFDFDQAKLLSIAEEGKKLGAELFVLDDGWFGERNNDHAGLGDYQVNREKLPEGLAGLSEKIHALGLSFGLWFEPEAVNPDSDLYRRHPEYALHDTPYKDLYGRNELLLDLTKKEVRDYIVENVSAILDEAQIDYVKWDMNRQMTGHSAAFDYDYIQGLYEVLDRIFTPRPQILLESCSSGGNRFDAGMLCYSQQIWGSDDTDPVERLDIQKGYSYLYPVSAIGSHVSMAPHGQTMRITPLHTRFHTACYGAFGYELDLTKMNEAEKREIRNETSFYKANRHLFQYGEFSRSDTDDAHEEWTVRNGNTAITTVFRRMIHAASGFEKIHVHNLPEGEYEIKQRTVFLNASPDAARKAQRCGVNETYEDGSVSICLPAHTMKASKNALECGLPLNSVFTGGGWNPLVRTPLDAGSEMYVITPVDDGYHRER